MDPKKEFFMDFHLLPFPPLEWDFEHNLRVTGSLGIRSHETFLIETNSKSP